MTLKLAAIASLGASLTCSLATWWVTHDVLTAKHKAEVMDLREGATVAFNKAVVMSLEVERLNNAHAQKLEIANAKNRKTLDAVGAENRRLAALAGGLRDPYATASSCPVPTITGTPTGTIATASQGRLSNEASEFLFAFARDADRAAEYAMTCSQFVQSVGITLD